MTPAGVIFMMIGGVSEETTTGGDWRRKGFCGRKPGLLAETEMAPAERLSKWKEPSASVSTAGCAAELDCTSAPGTGVPVTELITVPCMAHGQEEAEGGGSWAPRSAGKASSK